MMPGSNSPQHTETSLEVESAVITPACLRPECRHMYDYGSMPALHNAKIKTAKLLNSPRPGSAHRLCHTGYPHNVAVSAAGVWR